MKVLTIIGVMLALYLGSCVSIKAPRHNARTIAHQTLPQVNQ